MEKLTGSEGTLVPAYGRDYKSRAAAEADFRAGKDFKLCRPWGETYCSIRDFVPGSNVKIRYNKIFCVFIAKV